MTRSIIKSGGILLGKAHESRQIICTWNIAQRNWRINGAKFEDENFIEKYAGSGILSMAYAVPRMNGSQFFFRTAKTKWLDGKHVVFGQIMEGMNVVKAIEKVGSSFKRTSKPIVVADCDRHS